MFSFLNHWSNAPFLVMLGLVAVTVFLQAVGLFGLMVEGGTDHEVNIDADHDVDMDHETDLDGDADANADSDSDADQDVSGSGWHGALAYFGIGRVPLMVLVVTLFIFTGFSGIFLNSLAYVRFSGTYPGWVFPTVLGSSLTIGLVATRLFSRILSKIFDLGARGATAKHELSGRIGIVASHELGPKFGEVRVRDERGNELLVHARIETGEDPLKLGEEVILVDFDTESELFLATSSASEIRSPERMSRSRKE